MAQSERFSAQVLESGARGYAALATTALLERRPDLRADGDEARASWRAHLVQRMLELQTAVALGRPNLFVERVRWSRRAYQARGVAESQLRDALQCLREVLAEELPPHGRQGVLETVDQAVADFERPIEIDEREVDPESANGRRAMLYLLSVLEGRCRRAVDELLQAQREEQLPLRSCILDVLVPAQREIGRLWHLGDSDIAEEHLVTSTTKRAIAALSHASTVSAPRGLTVMTAAVEGDTHDVGGQALSALLEEQGWNAVDLGADVPAEDMVGARVALEPDLIVVSATLSIQLSALERTVRALRAEAGGDVRILVAGSACTHDADLPVAWGADAVACSLEAALDRIEGWFPAG